jgi:hypothetical protein
VDTLVDAVFNDLPDATIHVGTLIMPERTEKYGIVRVLIGGNPIAKPWPKTLEFRTMVDAGSGEKMFVLYGDGNILQAVAAVGWTPSCDKFVAAVEMYGAYMVEMYMPHELRRAAVMGTSVYEFDPLPITEEQFKNAHDFYIDTDLTSSQIGAA